MLLREESGDKTKVDLRGIAWSKWEAGPQLGYREGSQLLVDPLVPHFANMDQGSPQGSQLRHGGQPGCFTLWPPPASQNNVSCLQWWKNKNTTFEVRSTKFKYLDMRGQLLAKTKGEDKWKVILFLFNLQLTKHCFFLWTAVILFDIQLHLYLVKT